MRKVFINIWTIILLFGGISFGQPTDFKITKTIPHTLIKNQYRSNTCWAFAGISFLESEIIRKHNQEIDLSEMYIIKNAFLNKADRYVRMHGNVNFSGAGEFNDVIDIVRDYGIVPETAFSARQENMTYMHGEMDEVLKAYVDAIIKNKSDRLSNVWNEGFNMLLNVYLGSAQSTFTYKDQQFNAESFAKYLSIIADDYILVTSFVHHPYYKPFILEVPDNWSNGSYYNLKIEDLIEITDYSINNGYSVLWVGDISEAEFSWEQGVAYCSDKEINEKKRQIAFDNYETTDDHGMHIVGLAKDKNGEEFYYAKNSWGTTNLSNGYIYLSKDYFRYKTISLMVNKSSLPETIKSKLNLN